jgi:hypothetical protein
MADYRFVDGGGVVYQGNFAKVIPPDPANYDWQVYLAWVGGGGVTDGALSGSVTIGDQAAITAKAAVQSATDVATLKTALHNYFETIDQV